MHNGNTYTIGVLVPWYSLKGRGTNYYTLHNLHSNTNYVVQIMSVGFYKYLYCIA